MAEQTHTVFVVRPAAHEADDPSRAAWRAEHAAGTIAIVYAYFDNEDGSTPTRFPDGTFVVHAPSWTTLDTLRSMLTDHEGFTIVSETEESGNGIIVVR